MRPIRFYWTILMYNNQFELRNGPIYKRLICHGVIVFNYFLHVITVFFK